MAIKKLSEFRFTPEPVRWDKKLKKTIWIAHPAYIWAEEDNKYKHHKISHSKYVHGKKWVMFKVNPNPNDKRKSYFNPISSEKKVSAFQKRKRNWKLSNEDNMVIDNLHKKSK